MEENKIKIYSDLTSLYLIKNDKKFSFNKTSKNFQEIQEYNPSPDAKEYNVYSIVGNIKAKKYNYTICSSEVIPIGKILESNVFKIKKFIYIPNESKEIVSEDKPFLKMLDDFLLRNNLYFSDKIDLTISLVNLNKIKEDGGMKDSFIFPNSIVKYCWNYSIGKYFNIKGMSDFIYPIINGFVGIKEASEYGENTQFILIGRKDHRRSGVRLLIRGSDSSGHVANSSENEEIIIFKDQEGSINLVSFVQIRGSIPLMWTQEPSLNLNPQIRPRNDFDVNSAVFKMHIDEVLGTYNSVCCINLVDQKKDQKIIGDYYSKLIQSYKEKNKDKSNNIDFAWFDFHAECKKLKYENIKKLFKKNSVNKCLKSYGYTHIKIEKNVMNKIKKDEKVEEFLLNNDYLNFIKLQQGVFRTNCIDSLDRSNVVQSTFARYFLFKMLYELNLGINKESEDNVFQKFDGNFESIFKIIWADHGDGISLAYSGTGAMKSDFVRTGKRTIEGNLQDGLISLTRFYINNFRDGYFQDCNDYFLGLLNPKVDRFKNHSLLNVQILLFIAFCLNFYVYSAVKKLCLPKTYSFSLKKLLFKFILFVVCYVFTVVSMTTMSLKSFIDLHTRHE